MKSDPCVAAMLAERYGLDVQALGEAAVERAVRRRMAATGDGDPCQYARLMPDRLGEIDALVDEISVPETWFFRDQTPFEFLRQWAASGGRRRVCALSAGCATGEEAYSIAAALLEAGVPADGVRVLGIDFSARSLAAARQGRYRSRMPRPEIPARYRRLFSVDGDTVAVGEDLKRRVEFRRANLTTPGLLAGERFDVVFCRNVLIYLTSGGRRALLDNLERILTGGGILVVGGAEFLAVPEGKFRPAGVSGIFVHRHPAPAAAARERARPPAAATKVIEWPSAEPPARADLAEAQRLADEGRLEEAERICRLRTASGRPDPEAYFLLGLLELERDRLGDAEVCFRKVLYLEPAHQRALRQLALLAERRGDEAEARLLRRRAARARQKQESR